MPFEETQIGGQHSQEMTIVSVYDDYLKCRKNDIQWFYQYGASEIYPEFWKDYISIVDKSKTDEWKELSWSLKLSKKLTAKKPTSNQLNFYRFNIF